MIRTPLPLLEPMPKPVVPPARPWAYAYVKARRQVRMGTARPAVKPRSAAEWLEHGGALLPLPLGFQLLRLLLALERGHDRLEDRDVE